MRFIKLLIICQLLVSCFDSGGGRIVTSKQPVDSQGNKLAINLTASNFQTTEYNATGAYQNGLQQIKAAEAYASLANNGKVWSGQGVSVVVADSGVLQSHPDLVANYSSASQATSGQDVLDHGTHVAGIIAATKNDVGMHGVAPDAKIISVALFGMKDANGNSVTYGLGVNQWDAYVKNSGGTVINMSFSGDEAISVFQSIANNNSRNVLVAAAGNSGSPNPSSPASYASNADLNGQMLAVMAVNASNVRATGWGGGGASSHCGTTQTFCLAAPGNNIYSTDNTGSYINKPGTSMATPFVSGAAAVLQAAWPSLTGAQVVDILKTSATDLGTVGVDSTYGHGLLNLYQAVQSQGVPALVAGATVASAGHSLHQTSLVVPASYGTAFAKNLAAAMEGTIYFDKYGRDYKANLDEKITTYSNDQILEQYFSGNNIRYQNYNLAKNLNMQMRQEDDYKIGDNYGSYLRSVSLGEKTAKNDLNYFAFANDFKGGLNLAVQYNKYALTDENQFSNLEFMSDNNITRSDYLGLFSGDIYNMKLTKNWQKINFSSQFVKESGRDFEGKEAFFYEASYKGRQEQKVNFGYGVLHEKDHLLGMQGEGGLNLGHDNKTNLYHLSFAKNILGADFKIKYEQGFSKFDSDNSLIKAQGVIRSNALSLVAAKQVKERVMGVAYNMPMAVTKGKVAVNVPVARDIAGNVVRRNIDVTLVPEKREHNYEIFYQAKLAKNLKLNANAVYRFHANHEIGKEDFIWGIKLQKRF